MYKKLSIRVFLLFSLSVTNLFAQQTDSTARKINWSAYVDTYYAYNSQNMSNHAMPTFMYSYNRNKEFNINLALIQAQYSDNNVRGNLALMTGTYTNSNLASEPGVLKNIYEANVGVKLTKNKEIWLDVGVLSSHIGFESAKRIDNWALTPSLLADNSPYYETGIRLSYTSPNMHWYIATLAINGWQRIQKIDGNSSLSLGHQITYTNEKLTVNSSSFMGNTYPDSVKRMRYYHNLYARYMVHPKFGISAGFDVGTEQESKQSHRYNFWYASTAIARYQLAKKWFLATRWELFHDQKTTLIKVETPGSFIVSGYSANIDYQIRKNVLWRIEGEALNSKAAIFNHGNQLVKYNYTFTSSLSIAL